MTDRKLLEFAAKAAGWESWDWLEDDALNVYAKDGRHDVFEPLTDDGDALRLAVKLWLTVQVDDEDCRTYVVGSTGQCIGTEPHGDDPYSATRRAIVQAAAEIGRAM